jgi:hypothetical protein
LAVSEAFRVDAIYNQIVARGIKVSHNLNQIFRGPYGGAKRYNGYWLRTRTSFGDDHMTEEEIEKAKATAAAGVGAGVGTAGGASIGVLELAAQGTVTGLSAGLVIGLGAVAGAALGLAGYGLYRSLKKKQKS